MITLLHEYHFSTLVPRPPPFCSSVHVQYNTRKWKSIFRHSSASVSVYYINQRTKHWEQGYHFSRKFAKEFICMTCSG